jgi:hypothetical protein
MNDQSMPVLSDLNDNYKINGRVISRSKKVLVMKKDPEDKEWFRKRLKEKKELGKEILKELSEQVAEW